MVWKIFARIIFVLLAEKTGYRFRSIAARVGKFELQEGIFSRAKKEQTVEESLAKALRSKLRASEFIPCSAPAIVDDYGKRSVVNCIRSCQLPTTLDFQLGPSRSSRRIAS